MAQRPIKFTTAFGIIVMVLGFLLEVGALFYEAGSAVSAETVFTGAIVLTVGHAFYGVNQLWLSLLITIISSLGIAYFVLVQNGSWLWAIIAFIAFFAFIESLFSFRAVVKRRQNKW
ncbi:hypothetical protein [Secundilactobacillus folii]|uniref:Integral membrane protein n=1 Tax=Secundilactobacillus folii TaxID=2678357 RepID=A0A7X2XUW2_9LACO|nr:hypothetical protein [Secundilactobacillus folii]MTV82069.1 hypothetical protein [Secundilactobacillus folii]